MTRHLADDEGRSENRMASERELRARRKDPHLHVPAVFGWQQEDRLRKRELPREALHRVGVERPAVDEDTELVSFERTTCEDVANVVVVQTRAACPSIERGNDLSRRS
jgi:hypothetical protein